MKAQDESDVLVHMGMQFAAGGGKLSGLLGTWTEAKLTGLKKMCDHARSRGHDIDSVIDVGIGDMDIMRAWEEFPRIHYVGIEGNVKILCRAREEFPHGDFHLASFSRLINPDFALPFVPDAIFLMDVLYHIPDEQLAKDLVQWAVDQPIEYLVASYATDPKQTFDNATKAGEAGFAWFPHVFERPDEFEVIYSVASHQGMQSQRLDVLARSG